jgi:hypothetical protein
MTNKISPKKVPHFKKYNCSGKLRVEVLANGDVKEVILLPEGGGCKYNLQLIGRLLTLLFECNIDTKHILDALDKNDPCPAPVARMNREKLIKEEVGLGGCAKIILTALQEKLNEIPERKV